MWAALEGDLEKEARAIESAEFIGLLIEPYRSMFAQFQTALADATAVLGLYRVTLNALGMLPLDLSKQERKWICEVGEPRAIQLQASMTALAYVAHIEVTMAPLVGVMAIPERLREIGRCLRTKVPPSRDEVLSWGNPTRETDKWPRRVGAVFGFELSNAAIMALMTLLDARNAFLCQNRTLGARATLGSELRAWEYASVSVVGRAMLAVSQRMAASG